MKGPPIELEYMLILRQNIQLQKANSSVISELEAACRTLLFVFFKSIYDEWNPADWKTKKKKNNK